MTSRKSRQQGFFEMQTPASEEPLESVTSITSEKGGAITVDEAMSQAGFGRFHVKLLLICSVCWAADSMEILLLSFLAPEVSKEWDLPKGYDGALAAVVFVGIFFGNYFWGALSDSKGRRVGFIGVAVFSSIFGLLSAFAPDPSTLLFFRFCVGFGLGGAAVSFTLLTEYLPVQNRAKVLALSSVFWSLGAILEAFLAWSIIPGSGWRVFLAVSTIPMFIMILLSPIVPESPHYFVTSGQMEKATEALEKVYRDNGKPVPSSGLLLKEHAVVKATAMHRMRELFNVSYRHLTSFLWIIWFMDSFVYYGVTFFTPRYFSGSDVYEASFISTIAELPGVLLSYALIDRLGRRRSLKATFSMASISILLLAATHTSRGMSIFLLFIARTCISAAFNNTFIYTTEVYPTIMRSTGLGACSAISRIAGIITSFISEDVEIRIAAVTFGLASFVAALAAKQLRVETRFKGLGDDFDSVEMMTTNQNNTNSISKNSDV